MNASSFVWIRLPTSSRLKKYDIPIQEEIGESSDVGIAEMIAQLMTRQKEFMKEIGARMDRLEVEKVKKTQVENLDDEDKPIWDKDDRIDHERKKNTIADKIVAQTLKMKRKWSHVKMVLFP